MKTLTIDRPRILHNWQVMGDNNASLGGCNTPVVVMRHYFSEAVTVASEVSEGRFSVTKN